MGRILFTAGLPLLLAQAASANEAAPVALAAALPVTGAPAVEAASAESVSPEVASGVDAATAAQLNAAVSAGPETVAQFEKALSAESVPAAAAAVAALVQKDPVNAYRDLLMATNELWFLLSGIRDKADADRAAQRFGELVSRMSKMDENLALVGDEPQQQASLDQLRYQIMDAYCSVDSEFGGLCRVRCYGSQELVDAFQSAVAGGMFDADDLPLLEIHRPFTEDEARQELARIKRLAKPDKALLDCLRHVTDSHSAQQKAPELARLTASLRSLTPDSKLKSRNFHNASAPAVRAVAEPVESLLWGIRSEIVRIAGLPGYSDEPYDAFSDSLDEVYDALGETHSTWFNDVFDESFRIDLDEAYRENNRVITSAESQQP